MPNLGAQQLARARAAALDEDLDVMAIEQQPAHVRVDDRAVQLLALEAAADEERAAAPQDRAERKEAEVVARGDQRRRQLLASRRRRSAPGSRRGSCGWAAGSAGPGAPPRARARCPPGRCRCRRRSCSRRDRAVGAAATSVCSSGVAHSLLSSLSTSASTEATRAARALHGLRRCGLRSRGLLDDLFAQALRRLLARADHQRALALHAAQQRVANLVGGLGVGQLGIGVEEGLQIEVLARCAVRRCGS